MIKYVLGYFLVLGLVLLWNHAASKLTKAEEKAYEAYFRNKKSR